MGSINLKDYIKMCLLTMKKNEVSWFKLFKSDFEEIECGEEDFIYYKL